MKMLSRRGAETDNIDDVEPTSVTDECEAFLEGRLPSIARHGGCAPVWTWINPIAHRDRAALTALAGGTAGDVQGTTTQVIARAVLVDGRDLDVLQREVLVPLELAHVGETMTPRRLIELVGHALFEV